MCSSDLWTSPVVETDPGMYRICTATSDADDDDLETGTVTSTAVADDALQTDAAGRRTMAELTGYPAPTMSAARTESDSFDDELEGTGHRGPWRVLAGWTSVPTWQIRSEGISLIILVTALPFLHRPPCARQPGEKHPAISKRRANTGGQKGRLRAFRQDLILWIKERISARHEGAIGWLEADWGRLGRRKG